VIRPAAQLHEEIAYLAYHFHWPLGDLLDLAHCERLRYVAEVAQLNARRNAEG
jgi:hypothetical protein